MLVQKSQPNNVESISTYSKEISKGNFLADSHQKFTESATNDASLLKTKATFSKTTVP